MKNIKYFLTIFLLNLSVMTFGQTTVSKQEYEKLKAELIEQEKLKSELEKNYGEAMRLLEESLEQNKQLNTYIDQQKTSLITMKQDIQKINSDYHKNLDRIRQDQSNLKATNEKLSKKLAECEIKKQ